MIYLKATLEKCVRQRRGVCTMEPRMKSRASVRMTGSPFVCPRSFCLVNTLEAQGCLSLGAADSTVLPTSICPSTEGKSCPSLTRK